MSAPMRYASDSEGRASGFAIDALLALQGRYDFLHAQPETGYFRPSERTAHWLRLLDYGTRSMEDDGEISRVLGSVRHTPYRGQHTRGWARDGSRLASIRIPPPPSTTLTFQVPIRRGNTVEEGRDAYRRVLGIRMPDAVEEGLFLYAYGAAELSHTTMQPFSQVFSEDRMFPRFASTWVRSDGTLVTVVGVIE